MKIGQHYQISAMVVLFFIGTAIYAYPRLPQRVASHFGANGVADGWMNKETYILFMSGGMIVITLLGWSMGWLMKVLPAGLINLPHKEYWFSGERREATLAFMKSYSVWVMVPTQVFLLLVFQMTIRMALEGSDKLPPVFFVLLGLEIVITLILAFYPLRRFRKGADNGQS